MATTGKESSDILELTPLPHLRVITLGFGLTWGDPKLLTTGL